MPEGPHLTYQIVAMDLYKRWQTYCNSADSEAKRPGFINEKQDLKNLLNISQSTFESNNDFFYRKFHLKDSAKEDVNYKVLDQKTFNYLFHRYGC